MFSFKLSGTDTSIFIAHYVKGASSSRAANAGVTTNNILILRASIPEINLIYVLKLLKS